MRVVLVGARADRDRLRTTLLASGLNIVAEVLSVADARTAGLQHEALLIAPPADTPDSSGGGTSGLGADHLQRPEISIETLTPREHDVLRLLALGLPNKAIAARLVISDQTVKFHVAAILGKLGAVNRTDAVRRAARRGLIEL